MADALAHLAAVWGYVFRKPELLKEALTHTSVLGAGRGFHMERFEFLGDAVVGLAVTDLIVRMLPEASEGVLTMTRARLVNTMALARKAREVGLAEHVVLGRGEEKTGGREKPSILAGVFEAVIGAVFLDGGFDAARAVIEQLFRGDVARSDRDDEDAKTCLQELTQGLFKQLPVYKTLGVGGPDHERDFVVEVAVGERVLGRGRGRSKREAAQAAAREALAALRTETDGEK